jgi:hypothetical protein
VLSHMVVNVHMDFFGWADINLSKASISRGTSSGGSRLAVPVRTDVIMHMYMTGTCSCTPFRCITPFFNMHAARLGSVYVYCGAPFLGTASGKLPVGHGRVNCHRDCARVRVVVVCARKGVSSNIRSHWVKITKHKPHFLIELVHGRGGAGITTLRCEAAPLHKGHGKPAYRCCHRAK